MFRKIFALGLFVAGATLMLSSFAAAQSAVYANQVDVRLFVGAGGGINAQAGSQLKSGVLEFNHPTTSLVMNQIIANSWTSVHGKIDAGLYSTALIGTYTQNNGQVNTLTFLSHNEVVGDVLVGNNAKLYMSSAVLPNVSANNVHIETGFGGGRISIADGTTTKIASVLF